MNGMMCRVLSGLCAVIVLASMMLAGTPSAHALEPIVIDATADSIEVTRKGELYSDRGDSLQVETAAGRDGPTARMSVRAVTPGTNPNWIVFALTNSTGKEMERWLTAERYEMVGSGAIWPDLDARRIEAVTPSVGFVPERVQSDRADIFRITLEPGQTITFVAEMSSERYVRLSLWDPLAYELKIRDRRLFNGILLGLTGLLAIFLTAVFAANHKAIFPTAAIVSWCVLTYLCVDFGFFHKLFNLRPEDNAVYRAATEASMAASLVIFMHTFLRLGLSHGIMRMLMAVWIMAQLSLIAVAAIDPRLAATFARLSFVLIGVVGALLTLFLAARGQDRALSLIPTWLLFLVWIFGAGVALMGKLSGDVAVAGLLAGLVLITILIGFTVTQFAFRTLEPVYGAAPNELQLRSLALDSARASVWEWNGRRDEVKVSPQIEASLGLNPGELSDKTDEFVKHIHTDDRERFRLMLWSAQERGGGRLHGEFRLRHSDSNYRWFDLEAAMVPNSDRRNVRCVGLLREITEHKRTQERLLQNAVLCSLTGLPNRELFLDRLRSAILRAKSDDVINPTVLVVDIDKFKSVNESLGPVVGDTLLLTVARRLQRHLGLNDTVARLGGDQFSILLIGEQDASELAAVAERVRRSLRSPIKIAGQDVVLTGSVGLAVFDGVEEAPEHLLKNAEIAMYRAKRGGADRIELYRPEMRTERGDHAMLEEDLRTALEKNQIKVVFQPIVYLPTEELAGFEALLRWQHPKLGEISPSVFIPIAEQSDLIVKLGSYVLMRSAHTAAKWQKELPRVDSPLFVSVNVSSRQLFRPNLIQEVRHILSRAIIPKGVLRLEITESLVMENAEKAVEMLESLRSAGVDLALDDFGSGYSSLAYLQRFPFDTIKIDKEIVQAGVTGEEGSSAIVRSIVALSHELGKKVIAEGIEHPDDVGFLRSISCEYGQGYYYGEAMQERDVVQLLRIVRKSESKIEAKGMFRTKLKKKKQKKKAEKEADLVAAQAKPVPQGVVATADSSKAGQSVRVASSLPQSTVRPVTKPTGPVGGRVLPVGARPDATTLPPPSLVQRPAGAPPSHPHQMPVPAKPMQRAHATGPLPPPVPTTPIKKKADARGGASASGRNGAASGNKKAGLPQDLQNVLDGGNSGPAHAGPAHRAPVRGGNGRRSAMKPPPPPPPPMAMPTRPSGGPPDDQELDLSTLPPGIAASLARLAGKTTVRPVATGAGGGQEAGPHAHSGPGGVPPRRKAPANRKK